MIAFLHNVQIRTRLLFIVALLLIGVTILTATSLFTLHSSMVQERSAKIIGVMDGAMGIVSHFHQLQVDGKLSEDQAKQQALDTLTQMRYEKTNYIFGYDKNFLRILHPAQPDTVGKDFKQAHDVDGVYFIQEMVEKSMKSGSAIVYYRYAKPNQTGDFPKMAYVAYNADWGWILGTGVYLDDLNSQFLSAASVDIAIGVILLVVISALTLIISRGILAQLGGEPIYAVEVVTQVSQGNLTIRTNLHPNDRTSLLAKLQLMVQELRKLLVEVRTASESIQVSATEIAQGNMDLSGRTESQSASLEETASSMNELTSTVRKNSESARKASDLANTASDVAVHGGAVVKTVVDTMESIKQSSGKIVDIISVIDGIAFQTNILALNAAVEAARAGEQGRGFAVVASEVRTLAQRSASAAKEIKELIQDSVDKVQAGASQVNDAGKAMNEIVESIKHVTQIMTEIADASQEQTQGIEQVNIAIVEMDGVTQQNAALVEQAAAAAQSMQDQSKSLVENISSFRLN